MKKVPKRRFKGFLNAGDWEQRKLISCIQKVIDFRGRTPNKLGMEWSCSGHLALSALNVKDGYIDFSQDNHYGDNDLYEKWMTGNELHKGQVVFTTEAPMGNVAQIPDNERYILSQRTVAFCVDENIITENFLAVLLRTPVVFKTLTKLSSGGTAQGISQKSLAEIEVRIPPNLHEQQIISNFLLSFEHCITLHQRKLEKLQATKKALLYELFPIENSRRPKLRFKGFTGDWEQRKLSKLATMNARIGWQNLRTSEFLDSGDYLLITGTDFDNGRIKYSTCHYVEKKRFDQDTKIQLSTGSILITKDGTLGKVALVEELPKPATLNAGVFNVRVKDDAFLSYKYLYHYLKAPFLMKYVIANATGGTIKHLNQSILVDFPIPITEKHEQDKIAKLLDSLESIITLHQRKLEKLKNLKAAYLNEMFV